MIFTAITFIAAFLIEAIGTVVSVIGLSTLFGANPIIIALAVALDIGKLVVVALLYKYWGELNRLMKIYGLIAAFVTMTITSAGAAGYLSGEFQKAIVGTQEVALKVDLLKQEQARLQERKQQIDQQIANLPANFSRARVTLMRQFEAEQTTITTRLAEIDRELPTLQVTQINTEAKAGPILYIAKAFDISVEEAVKYVILLIIFVFDPLAVFLIVAGNFLLEKHRKAIKPDGATEKTTTAPLGIIGLSPPSSDPATKADIDAVRQEVALVPLPVSGVAAEEKQAAAAPIYEIMEPTPRADLYPANPEPSDFTIAAHAEAKVEPQEITKSTLGIVEPDPTVKGLEPMEVGYRTGVYRTGVQSK